VSALMCYLHAPYDDLILLINVKVKVKFTLEQATKAQRGSRSIAQSFLNLGARWGWVVNATPRSLYPRERPGTHCVVVWVGLRADLD
jgi:hypothetical protein